jgi:methionine-rich copper-binding protein CopC
MTVIHGRRRRAVLDASIAAALLVGLGPGVAVGHSEFVSVSPADGSTVAWRPGTSIVITFSEALQNGSRADISGPGGAKVGTATVDPGNGSRLTFTPPSPLDPGTYSITWTSVAQDRAVLRSKVPLTFTVTAPAASASRSPSPTVAPPTTSLASAARSSTPGAAGSTAGEVLLPLIAALVVIAALGAVLLRSRRSRGRP